MTQSPPAQAERPVIEVSVELLAWIGVAAAFLLLRLGVIWQSPVGGEELPSLSGAWQAASGNADARFIPTLFQAISTLLLDIRDSEVLPRIVAYIATATVPLAVLLLRPLLGPAGALGALLLLVFDGVAIHLGVAATVSAFDFALLAWGFVLIARPDIRERIPAPAFGVIGFFFATAGALVLPFLFALVATDNARSWLNPSPVRISLMVGALIGLLLANLGFGYGWNGFVVPPFAVFIDAFEDETTSLSAADMMVVYTWPLLVAGIVGALLMLRDRDILIRPQWLLLTWLAFAVAWLVAAAGEKSTLPAAAVSLPLALAAAPALVASIGAIRRADWRVAKFAVAAGTLLLIVAGAYVADWARNDNVGDPADVARVIALLAAALAAFAVAAVDPASRASLLVPAYVIGGVVMVVGAFGTGLSSINEPLPSPISPHSARVLHALALETREERGGEIVVHPEFEEEIVWPFRDSGDIIIASRVPDDATVVLWPQDQQQPEGFAAVEGDWSLLATPASPTEDWLQLVRWYIDRNVLSVSHTGLAVYIRTE